MKIAICMHGIVGGCGGKDGRGESIDLDLCKRTMDKKILCRNPEVDFFVHSWSVEKSEKILDLYNPVKFRIENQIKFSDDYRVHLSTSRWHSSTEVLKMKSEYEKEKGFIYDVVMTSRFDMVWLKPLEFQFHNMSFFWASLAPNRSDVGVGKKHGLFIEDFFFFSNSKNMDYLGAISDNIVSRNNHKAIFHHLMSGGLELKFTMTPPKDYDLYRWWSGKDKDYPRKWYAGTDRENE